MPNPLLFLIAFVVLLIVVSIIWQVFNVGALFATMNRTQRLLWALLGLLVIVAVFWWFFTRYPLTGF